VLAGFFTVPAGTWDIRVHAMPYNTLSAGTSTPNDPNAASYVAAILPVVSCSVIDPNTLASYTEYASVPYIPSQSSQPGTTGVAQLEINRQLTTTDAATFTIKCSVTSAVASSIDYLGVANINVTAQQVAPL
jgi:hypothetical protein